MENQTRFSLNAAIENWRNELAAQPNLASEDRRELETHLRDAITGFQQRGLSDEESFWLARHRVGQPQQLGEEFVKADPVKIWRERVFWMWLAVFLSNTLGSLAHSMAFAMMPFNFQTESFVKTRQLMEMTVIMVSILTPLIIAILLARGRLISQFSRLMVLLEGRRRLAWAALGCVALSFAFRIASTMIFNSRLPAHMNMPIGDYLMPTIYSVVIALLLVWLMPRNEKNIQPA